MRLRPHADAEGFSDRAGDSLVPRLRRLRHPAQVQKVLPAGHPAREHRVRFRDRVLVAVSLLPQHLRISQHSRPGTGRSPWA